MTEEKWSWLNVLAPYLPPAFGAMIGLRWATEQTPFQRVVSFVSGFGLGVWFGPAISEALDLLESHPKATVAIGILTAIVGMDVIGGLIVAVVAFRKDPIGTVKSWWSVWRGS